MEAPLSPSVLPENDLCSLTLPSNTTKAFSGTSEISGKKRIEDWLFSAGHAEDAEKLAECALRVEHWKCDNGHDFYFRKYCGREYCPICGAKGSYYHNRRIMRAAEHFIWAVTWGNLTFTMPKEASERRLNKTQLRRLQDLAWQATQRILRVGGTGVTLHLLGRESAGLHVHFEALFHRIGCFNKGLISKPQLKAIKKVWALLLNKELNLNLKIADVKYSFAASKRKKWHKLKYIHRPICNEAAMLALSDKDKEYILSLKGYHRTRWYGDLANKNLHEFLRKHWAPLQLRETPLIEKRVCPMCKTKLRYVDWCWISDIPKTLVVQYSNDIWWDRAVDAHQRLIHNKEGP